MRKISIKQIKAHAKTILVRIVPLDAKVQLNRTRKAEREAIHQNIRDIFASLKRIKRAKLEYKLSRMA